MTSTRLLVLTALTMALLNSSRADADPPLASYAFPAGGQRGANVTVRVGGCNLHDSAKFIWQGAGVTAPDKLTATSTLWFEGPVIPQPASQQKEDYPKDFLAALTIGPNAPLGQQSWRLATSQGVTSAWGFVIGDFPEVVEEEVDGQAPAVRVTLPVTINGRIFPREDVDAWSFVAKAGQVVTCHVATSVFGSPLDARIEVRDQRGRLIGERLPEGTVTPPLRFTAPADGEYEVRIHDTAFGGLQDHVYRLTVTSGPSLDAVYPLGGRRGAKTRLELIGVNLQQPSVEVALPAEGSEFVWRLDDSKNSWGEVRLDLDDFDEVLEVEPNDMTPQMCSVPSVLNGRIQQPGDVDVWQFEARKGIEYQFEARAARLGSPLDAVLEVIDEKGKTVAEADDLASGQTDARLRFTAPADGVFKVQIHDRLAARGDHLFAYRIRVTSGEQPEFALELNADATTVERGKTGNVKLTIDRGPSFKEPVALEVEGLPRGVTLSSPAVIAPNQKDVQLQFKVEADAPIVAVPLKIVGKAKVGDREQVQVARIGKIATAPGANSPPVATDSFWLAVAPPTPFKFVGIFETKFIPRGSVFVRRYRIERNGFEGPLDVQLADRQGRHLQGVTASAVVVPPGQSEFEFAVTLPPWMEIGRTCRSTLSVSGIVSDPDGSQYRVSYSSNDQNNQMIALVDPGRLAIQPERTTIAVKLGQRLQLPLQLSRDRGLTGDVTIELVSPKGCQGVSADALSLKRDQNQGTLMIEVAPNATGLELRPVTIRATTRDERGFPVTAEFPLVLTPAS